MKLTTPFNALRNATSDMWRMHDFNYKLPKNKEKDYWNEELSLIHISEPTRPS